MKGVVISNCERDFIRDGVLQNRRIDGRHAHEFRNMDIAFGSEWGSCQVSLGKTRAIVQVSCEVVTPQPVRPSEGLLFINVEISPMAAPQYEPGKPSDTAIEIARIIERCIKDSRCIDLEALCIVTASQVWQIRVDTHIVNDDGNMTDCACIAAIGALMHCKHPDVTVSGEDIVIHPVEKRDPVPLSIHHIPVCITFAFFDNGNRMLVDPTEREECAMEGKMVYGMNSHREICTLHLGGTMLLLKEQVLRCSQIAAIRANEITAIIKKKLSEAAALRKSGKAVGFQQVFKHSQVTVNKLPIVRIETPPVKAEIKADEKMEEDGNSKAKVVVRGQGTAQLQVGDGGPSTWDEIVEEIDDEEDEDDGSNFDQSNQKKGGVNVKEDNRMDTDGDASNDDEEEDSVVILASSEYKSNSEDQPTTVDLTKALKKTKR